MAFKYYKDLLTIAALSDAFDEHLDKHCMSREETQTIVQKDDRHDPIGRFYVEKEEIVNLVLDMIDEEHPAISKFCYSAANIEKGDCVKRVFNLKMKGVGESVFENDIIPCDYAVLVLFFKKGFKVERDEARIASFYPVPKPVKFHS